MVFSSFATNSFFSRTLNSCLSAMVVSFLAFGCAVISSHLDRLRLVALGARKKHSENAVSIFGLDAFGIDFDGHGPRPVEPAREPLPAMQRRLLWVADRLFAGQPDGSALHLHVEVGLFDPWKLGDNDEVIAFAEHVERRIGAAAAKARIEPRACSIGVNRSIVECPLLARQGWKNEVMRHQRGLNQGGIDPAQRCKIVGLILRAGAERSAGDRQGAVDSGVAAMQGAGRGTG